MNKNTFDRVLRELREPVPRPEIERSTARVLESLEAGEPARLISVVSLVLPVQAFRWKAIAAGVVVMAIAGALPLSLLQPIRNAVVARAASGRIYREGESIRAQMTPVLVSLADGSRMEMSPRAVLSISNSDDGIRVFLSEGHVIVTAAKQHGGHLRIETKDCVVSVVGTVFSVKAGPEGSRVSVVEGEVQVRQGATTQTLLPGQQVSTSPSGEPVSVRADIEWSSQGPELVALLQQTAPPVPPPPAPPNLEGTIRGVVTLPGTNEPVAGVSVGLCPDPDVPAVIRTDDGRVVFNTSFEMTVINYARTRCESLFPATTDASGRFVIKDVEPGRYVVRAKKSGYVPPLADIPAPASEYKITRALEQWGYEGAPPIATQNATMADDLRSVEANVTLVRAAKVSGKVRVADRNRFAGYVLVQLGTISRAGGGTTFRLLTSVNTGSSGDYRFRLSPGEYVLFAGKLEPNSTAVPPDAVRINVKEGEDLTLENLVYREPASQ